MTSATSQPITDAVQEGRDNQLYLAVDNEIRSQRLKPIASIDGTAKYWLWKSHALSALPDLHSQIHGVPTPVDSPHTDDAHPRSEQLANSTSDSIERELLLEARLTDIFASLIRNTESKIFAHGMHPAFDEAVSQSIDQYGQVAVHAWERALPKAGNLYDAGEPVFSQTGQLEHVPAYAAKMRALQDGIKSHDARIHATPGSGLSFLNQPYTLHLLEGALAPQTEEWVKTKLKVVIDQFKHHTDATISETKGNLPFTFSVCEPWENSPPSSYTAQLSEAPEPAPRHEDQYSFLAEALEELERAPEYADEEGLTEPSPAAIENAKKLLPRMFRILPRWYRVYPMSGGAIGIDVGPQGQRTFLFCMPDGTIFCKGWIDGENFTNTLPGHEGHLDATLTQSLRQLGNGKAE